MCMHASQRPSHFLSVQSLINYFMILYIECKIGQYKNEE